MNGLPQDCARGVGQVENLTIHTPCKHTPRGCQVFNLTYKSRPSEPQAWVRAIVGGWRIVRPLVTVSLSLFVLVLACQELPPAPTDVDPTSSPTQVVRIPEPKDPPETSARVPISILADDSERWLSVVAVEEGADGAWATGSFKAKRNRLDIRTEDVQTFTLDTSRIPIRWDKPVVMNINGRTGELRRRDYALLSFELDGRGEWVVVEP